MNAAPLAKITDEAVLRLTSDASETLMQQYNSVAPQTPALLNTIARMSVAATGGHVAVNDEFVFECLTELFELKAKEQRRWKRPVDDRKGTRRRMYWDGVLLRVNDDRGVGVPIVPLSISSKVNRLSKEFEQKNQLPDFRRQRAEERVFQAAPPQTAPAVAPRYKHRDLRHGPRA